MHCGGKKVCKADWFSCILRFFFFFWITMSSAYFFLCSYTACILAKSVRGALAGLPTLTHRAWDSQPSQISHRHSALAFSHARLVVLASSDVNTVNLRQKNISAQDKNCNDMCHGRFAYSQCLTKLPSYHLIKTLKAVKAEKELFCCVQYITSDKRPNSACVAALCSTASNNRWLKTAKLPEIAFSLSFPINGVCALSDTELRLTAVVTPRAPTHSFFPCFAVCWDRLWQGEEVPVGLTY